MKYLKTLTATALASTILFSASVSAENDDDKAYKEGATKEYYDIFYDERCDNNHLLTRGVFYEDGTIDDLGISVDGYPVNGVYNIRGNFVYDRGLTAVYNSKKGKINNPILTVTAKNCTMFNRYYKNKATDNYGNKYEVKDISDNLTSFPNDKGLDIHEERVEILLDMDVLRNHKDEGLVITLHTYTDEENDGLYGKYSQNVLLDAPLIQRLLMTSKDDVSYVQ